MRKETFQGIAFCEDVLERPGIVLLDVFAPWCKPCQEQARVLDEVALERPDVAIVEMDFDANKDLARDLGVTGLPMLVVYLDGIVETAHRGLLNKAAVLDLIDSV